MSSKEQHLEMQTEHARKGTLKASFVQKMQM